MLKLIRQLLEEDMEEGVIKKMYKKLMTKELFMTFTGFEEVKERYPNIAKLIEEVIKGWSRDIY